MQEKYSSGFHSEVYFVNNQQKLWFPHADLVRLDKPGIADLVDDENRFKRLFYVHKVVKALFPDNFINVVAARTETRESLHEDLLLSTKINKVHKLFKSRTNMLFSQRALVPNAHAAFSDHMFDSSGGKVSIHDCDNCIEHRAFHQENNLQQKAVDIALPMKKIGIDPPIQDPSDYCLTKEGKIIFFEIQDFERQQLETHLSSLESRTENEEIALRLLNRHNVLLKDSRRVFYRVLVE